MSIEKKYPVTVYLDKYDIQAMEMLCNRRKICEDELFSMMLVKLSDLVFSDSEFESYYDRK